MSKIVSNSSNESMAAAVHKLFKTLDEQGVKFTPVLRNKVREFSLTFAGVIRTRLSLELVNWEMPDSMSPMDVLDNYQVIQSNYNAMKMAIDRLQFLEEDCLGLAETILEETVKMFDEVLTTPMPLNNDKKSPSQTKVSTLPRAGTG